MNSLFQEMIVLIQMLLVMDQAAKLWSAGLLILHTIRVFEESVLVCQLNYFWEKILLVATIIVSQIKLKNQEQFLLVGELSLGENYILYAERQPVSGDPSIFHFKAGQSASVHRVPWYIASEFLHIFYRYQKLN